MCSFLHNMLSFLHNMNSVRMRGAYFTRHGCHNMPHCVQHHCLHHHSTLQSFYVYEKYSILQIKRRRIARQVVPKNRQTAAARPSPASSSSGITTRWVHRMHNITRMARGRLTRQQQRTFRLLLSHVLIIYYIF